ncbi:hypothetical protein KY348_01855 [Candidatus Woesearchaeota archaeon]|nr:hypothetical protein [Candidatus Woesearchaeota archaeon]
MNKKKRMHKKSQMQMSETIFVIFIIIIIILIGFVAYSKFQEQDIKEYNRQQRNMRVIELAHRISSWPELECSVTGVTEFVCLDITKIMVFEDFMEKSKQEEGYAFNYYFDLLKKSKITVKEVYPMEREWVIYNNPGRTLTTDEVPIPVNLYNPLTDTNAFGIMELLVYE